MYNCHDYYYLKRPEIIKPFDDKECTMHPSEIFGGLQLAERINSYYL